VIPRPARPVFRRVFDEWVAPATAEAGYSPTGRAFWREPWVRRFRRFVVIQQAGGLDVLGGGGAMRMRVVLEYDVPGDYQGNKVADALVSLAGAYAEGVVLVAVDEVKSTDVEVER